MVFNRLISLVVAAGLAAVLGWFAYDQSGPGRILRYDKGTYLGKPDTGLSDAQRGELRARAMMQAGG